MASYLTRDLVWHVIVFQAVVLLIALSNALVLRRSLRVPRPARWPRVSVLVPARNEAANIRRCLASLLAQDYPHYEVLALDDNSTDGTGEILAEMAAADGRLRALRGEPLPAGWLGKNWACAQLAAQAGGELLLFTDADTWHAPGALAASVASLEGQRADLLTGFPRQELGTWGERLVVPFFGWAACCFVPLWPAYRLRWPALSMAVGQMLLFRREAYEAIGGHAAVRGAVAEDLALARHIVAGGWRWRMMHAAGFVSCRMYRGAAEARAGMTKNLFAAFGFRLLPYAFIWLWLSACYLWPPALLGIRLLGGAPLAEPWAIVGCLALSLALWTFTYAQLRLPWPLGALHMATVAVLEYLAARSLWASVTGRLQWKGRTLDRPRWRLI